MEKAVLWIKRSVVALIVLVLLMWASIAWAVQSNASVSRAGQQNSETQMTVQERWQCNLAAGPACLVLNR